MTTPATAVGETSVGPPGAARRAIAPGPTGTRATRVIGALALAGLPILLLLGLVTSPEDLEMGDSVRIMYVHVPSAWLAYLAFAVTALGSILYLWPRTRSLGWDRLAGASAEIGVLFTGLALVTGMLWGRPTWGVYWTWDARLTSTALLFLLFLGYLAIRRLSPTPEVRAKRAAIAGLIAFVDVPIAHMSVDWWRSLHQDATIARRDLDAQLDGTMLFTLFFGLVVFTLVYVWLLMHRQRQLWLEDHQSGMSLDAAIAARRAEARAIGGR
jgi:heme exporter protein C